MTNGKQSVYTVTMQDKAKLEALRMVLAYEGAVRGLTAGAALVELLTEAADLERYPDDLKAVLEELECERLSEAEGFVSDYVRLVRSA